MKCKQTGANTARLAERSLTISSLTRTQVCPGLPRTLQVVPHSLWGLTRAIYFWSTQFCLGSEVFCLCVKQLLLLDSCRRESSCLASAQGRCCLDKTVPLCPPRCTLHLVTSSSRWCIKQKKSTRKKEGWEDGSPPQSNSSILSHLTLLLLLLHP